MTLDVVVMINMVSAVTTDERLIVCFVLILILAVMLKSSIHRATVLFVGQVFVNIKSSICTFPSIAKFS